jgi:hypothetical protein
MRWFRAFALLGILIGSGCNEGDPARKAEAPPEAVANQAPARGAPLGPAAAKQAADKPPARAERKIIYTGLVDLIVDDFDQGVTTLLELLKERQGYVAKSEVRGTPGSPRSGTWTVRVPAGRFDDFVAALKEVGELRRSNTDSNDITDAFFDLQAHIKNDETREEGLRKLYLDRSKDPASKLEDLLTIDRELSAVRGKIDAQKGQLQRWDKDVAFSTATVTMQDRKAYVPPVVPDFGGDVGRAFQNSVQALVGFGKFLVLAAATLAPWAAVLAVIGLPAWLTVRRRRLVRARSPG